MTRVLLASQDPVFSLLCRDALAGTHLEVIAAVPPARLLEATRQDAPELVVIDVDAEDFIELKALTTKLMLVSDARVVLTAAYLGPGSPGLCALLQAIAAGYVQKPGGPSSLGLADEDGAAFVAALEATLAPATLPVPAPVTPRPRSATLPPAEIDSGWEDDK
jgi:DNA-binding NarL/FixJ family response regulator